MVDNNRVDTRDISSGIEKSGLHIKQGIEEASRNVQAGIEQGGKNIQIGIETGARKFSKSVEDHGNSVRVGMSEASEVFGHKFHETGIHASNTLQHESQRWRSFASQYILIGGGILISLSLYICLYLIEQLVVKTHGNLKYNVHKD